MSKGGDHQSANSQEEEPKDEDNEVQIFTTIIGEDGKQHFVCPINVFDLEY